MNPLPRRLLALLFGCALAAVAEAQEDVSVSTSDPSPDGSYALRSKRGPEMLSYDEVAIVTQPGGRVAQALVTAQDAVEDIAAAWAPDSRRLAFYRGGMSGGHTEILNLRDDGSFAIQPLPEVTLPIAKDMADPANEWINDYIRPGQWLSNDKLALKMTGRVSYATGKPTEKVYDYEYEAIVILDRGEATVSSLKEIKKTQVPRY